MGGRIEFREKLSGILKDGRREWMPDYNRRGRMLF